MSPLRLRIGLFACTLSAALVGCGSGANQPPFPELSPVKGIVTQGGHPVSGGAIRFSPTPDTQEFIINSEVGGDGSYSLSTVRTTDKRGERKPGAPVGSYKVTYVPPLNTKAVATITPVDLKGMVTIKPGDNDLPIDLPAKK